MEKYFEADAALVEHYGIKKPTTTSDRL